MKEIRKSLWTPFENDHFYGKNEEIYHNHLLDQYKIYVEMADRISSRRNLANVFFLTLHSSMIAAIGFAIEKIGRITPEWILISPFVGVMFLCVVWWWLIRSYKNLNTAKYKVVGLLEEKLPASPYYRAEWKALGEGKSLKKYLPLTLIEQWVPIIFGLMYITLGLYLLL